jgi:hypothetical protein
MERQEQEKRKTIDQPVVPEEHFSDVFWTTVTPWSAAVTFGLRMAGPGEKDLPKIRVRMPLQQAKALAVILIRAIRHYENEANVTVELPKDVIKNLGIPIEDWERFKL